MLGCRRRMMIPVPVILAIVSSVVFAVTPTGNEMALAARQNTPSFSFLYDRESSRDFLSGWKFAERSEKLDDLRLQRTRTYSDPRTGLEVRCVSIEYADFPAVEWVMYFTNSGRTATPILTKILPLDMRVPARNTDEIVLHGTRGDDNSAQSFAPQETVFPPDSWATVTLAPIGGRSSDGTSPFFGLDWRTGGVAVAVGWSGQWQAVCGRDPDGAFAVRAGQQTAHFRLLPGETVRTPRILLVFWQGPDPLRGTNLFRQILLKHFLPRRNGALVFPPICASVNEVDPGGNYEGPHVRVMKPLAERGYEVFWSDMDPQQWYPGGFPEGTGNWEVDTVKYPHGLKPVAEAAHEAGLGYLLWFEPERVFPGTRLHGEHPEWLIKPDAARSSLFGLHIPEARKWITDLMDTFVTETRLDWMRWDFNIEPLTAWTRADAPDRRGTTEAHYIEGLYAMWDDLRARHPGLVIDVCASGGRRIDIETLRRGLPLWHSDLQCDGSHPAADQLQNDGLNRWLPFHGTLASGYEPAYAFRSGMTAGNINVGAGADGLVNNDHPETLDATRRTTAVYGRVRPFMTGDYYPLFPHTAEEDAWFGYQFHRPDLDAGMAMLFRREKCAEEDETAKLRDIDPKASYEVEFVDAGETRTMSGPELASLKVRIPEKPGSALIFYKKAMGKE
jgi:alpha-galactosidase